MKKLWIEEEVTWSWSKKTAQIVSLFSLHQSVSGQEKEEWDEFFFIDGGFIRKLTVFTFNDNDDNYVTNNEPSIRVE